jgi:hypothetical protein
MSTPITIYIKNMAGEMSPLEVSRGTTPSQLVKQLSALNKEVYPIGRTVILQEEEQKEEVPLTEEEVVCVFVKEGAQKESGCFIGGKPYTRLLIPFDDQTLYLYVMSYHVGYLCNGLRRVEYGASLSPEITKPSETFQSKGLCLYEIVRDLVPDVTPSQMKYLYSIVLPYYDELAREENVIYHHYYNEKERIECDCGSIIQQSSVSSHQKTKKHMAFMKSQ